MQASEIEARLKEHFPTAEVKARDLTGGGDHWQVDICTKEFAAIGLVDQHKLVYQALGEWMKQEIHALALTTSAPKSSES